MVYLLGIDGGATGTAALLAKNDGTLVAWARSGPSNHLAVGGEQAAAVFADLYAQVAAQTACQPGDIRGACFALSAVATPSDEAIYRAAITPLGLSGPVWIKSDIEAAWAAATEGQPGIGLIAGTGSSCYGVNAAGQSFRALGWDTLLADQGSGYWVGLMGLQVAFKLYDGRLLPGESQLLAAMEDHYGQSAENMKRYAYQPAFTKGKIASFARRVVAAAEAGDLQAQAILQQAGRELGAAVLAVARRLDLLGGPYPVGLVGGMFRSGEWLLQPLRESVLSEMPLAQLQVAELSGAAGAVILAALGAGALSRDFLARLHQSHGPLAAQLGAKS